MRLFSTYQKWVNLKLIVRLCALGTGCYGTWKQLYLTEAITGRAFPLTWPKKGFPYIVVKKRFNFPRTGLEHQHGRSFIVLKHQYGGRDFM